MKSAKNPHGLTIKQQLVIKDFVETVKLGTPINITESHLKYYSVKKRSTASVIANENLNRPNFKEALYSMLEYEGVLGVSGKVNAVLSSGLDACQKTREGFVPDFNTRLKYIQEIMKIAGVY